MDRRAFLKGGAGALVGASALQAGCATLPKVGLSPQGEFDRPAAHHVEAMLERLDQRMAELQAVSVQLPASAPEEEREAALRRDALTRRVMRTLYFAGAIQGLSEAELFHPGVQARIARMRYEIASTLEDTVGHLDQLPPREREQIRQVLSRQPDLGENIGMAVHGVAREDGFRLAERMDVRYAFNDLSQRLRTQNPSLVIDRQVATARSATERARHFTGDALKARLGADEYDRLHARAAGLSAAWARHYGPSSRPDELRLASVYRQAANVKAGEEDEDDDDEEYETPPKPPHEDALSAASWLLGIGAIVEGVGLVLFFGVGGQFGVTVGGVMCLVIGPTLLALGLLALIVAGVMAASQPRPSRPPAKRSAPRESPPKERAPAPEQPPAPNQASTGLLPGAATG